VDYQHHHDRPHASAHLRFLFPGWRPGTLTLHIETLCIAHVEIVC
jgi:hypothetical protein